MGQTYCTFYMTFVIKFLSTDVKEHKILAIICNCMMHIPTIGFKFKQLFKVL